MSKKLDSAWDPEKPTIGWKKTFDGMNFFTTTPDHAGPNITYNDPEKGDEIKEIIEESGEDRAGRVHVTNEQFDEIKGMMKEDVDAGDAETSGPKTLDK
jgi:hypothetical protein